VEHKGIVHWELVPDGQTLTADYYCQQLDRVAQHLHGKQDKVFLLHHNARPHVAKKIRKKFSKLNWTIVPHSPYSPGLAPTDSHLFLARSDYLREKSFDDEDHLKRELTEFFASRSQDFYARGILDMPNKWQAVVDNGGQYLV
jgi:[histone H3]-lysine36 N-dimethyltransferase SETMAR